MNPIHVDVPEETLVSHNAIANEKAPDAMAVSAEVAQPPALLMTMTTAMATATPSLSSSSSSSSSLSLLPATPATPTTAPAQGPRRGKLVVIEGADGVGKTTLGTSLDDGGMTRCYMKIPNRDTVIGQVIDKYLKKEIEMDDAQAQLLFTANLLYDKNAILNSLREGKTVILDRYIPSAVVYYSHNVGVISRRWIETINRGLPKPDLVVVLQLDRDEALWRINKREMMISIKRERYDDLMTHDSISKLFTDVYGGSPDTVFVDAKEDPSTLRAKVGLLIAELDIDDRPITYYE